MKTLNLYPAALMLLLSFTVHSQMLDFSGPVSMAMASIKSFDQSSWSSLNNIANLANHQKISLSASYGRRFNMEELSSRAANAILPTKLGSFSGLILQSGYTKSNVSRYAFGYSRSFGNMVDAGLQFNFLTHQILASDRSDAFYSSLGVNMKMSQSTSLGVYIQNPEQNKISYANEEYELPTYFDIGLKWSAGSHFMFLLEFEKELNTSPVYKTAVQFNFKERLFIRSGVKSNPSEFTFGGGFCLASLIIDVGFSMHQQLGTTSSAGISYVINRKGSQ